MSGPNEEPQVRTSDDADSEDAITAPRSDLPRAQPRGSRFRLPSLGDLARTVGIVIGAAAIIGVVALTLLGDWSPAAFRTDDTPPTTLPSAERGFMALYGAELDRYHSDLEDTIAAGCDGEVPETLEWLTQRTAAAPESFSAWASAIVTAHTDVERAIHRGCARDVAASEDLLASAGETLDRAVEAFPDIIEP